MYRREGASLVELAAVTMATAMLAYPLASQGDSRAVYLGTWEYRDSMVHFTFLLRPDGTGYLADEVDTFPFAYSLDVASDPARLDLVYEVDMAFGRISYTLVRLEGTAAGEQLHWVSMHSESGPPAWPEGSSCTPPGVSWITFRRPGPSGHPKALGPSVSRCPRPSTPLSIECDHVRGIACPAASTAGLRRPMCPAGRSEGGETRLGLRLGRLFPAGGGGLGRFPWARDI